MAEQLLMMWPADSKIKPVKGKIPRGYRLRNFRAGDEEPYISVMRLAGFSAWDRGHLQDVLKNAFPDCIFFIEHIKTGEIVATAMGWPRQSAHFPAGVELGWVACAPAHCGKGLGYVVCSAVTRRLLELRQYQIYLKTDDFRLPAIKTYLKSGYVPFCYLPDMLERWSKVFEELHLAKDDYTIVFAPDVSKD